MKIPPIYTSRVVLHNSSFCPTIIQSAKLNRIELCNYVTLDRSSTIPTGAVKFFYFIRHVFPDLKGGYKTVKSDYRDQLVRVRLLLPKIYIESFLYFLASSVINDVRLRGECYIVTGRALTPNTFQFQLKNLNLLLDRLIEYSGSEPADPVFGTDDSVTIKFYFSSNQASMKLFLQTFNFI